MKPTTNFLITTVILSSLLGGGVAYAADGGTVSTNGIITFEANDEPTKPVNPLDPEKPIEPENPDNPGTAGPLSIDFASSFYFEKQKIASTTQTYYASPQKFKDGSTGPNYVQVSDNRGLLSGWELTVTQEKQFETTDNDTLNGAVMTLGNGKLATASEGTPAEIGDSHLVLTPGSAQKVMGAAVGAGAGTTVTRWGEAGTAGESVSLEVPGKAQKLAKTYSTKLTWKLADVPANGNS